MARFRHLRAANEIEWTHGVPNLSIKNTWEYPAPHKLKYDEDGNEIRIGPPDEHDYSDHSTALVNYGETQYMLSAHPAHPQSHMEGQPNFRWIMHQRVTPDKRDPDGWKLLLGPHRDTVTYLGDAWTKEQALRGAEANWRQHVERTNAERPGIGDYNINQIMRNEGF